MIPSNTRNSGLEVIGDTHWGTHLCLFYRTREDLIDILVPYFKAGLENNEFCMWITSEPLSADDARRSLQKSVKNLDAYIEQGQIEILDCRQWYTPSGKFDADQVLEGWVEKEAQAVNRGFDGLRLSGNTFWLEEEDWEALADYEMGINSIIAQYRIITICTYSLEGCGALEVIEVVSNHQSALIKREGKWVMIESAERVGEEQALVERMKELTCLYAVGRDMHEDLSVDEFCQRTLEHLVPAMQFPEITIPVIELNGLRFTSENYTEGLSHGLHAEIRGDGETCGHLWVYYAEERPFLIPEEQNLLNGIAELLGRWLEHKRAGEEIKYLATFPGENPNPVLRVARDGTLLYANQASRPLLDSWGCHLGQALPDEWQQLGTDVLTCGASKETEVEVANQILSLIFAPEVDGGYVNVYGLDISERVQAEQALRESESRYKQLVEKSGVAILIDDWDGNITYSNERLAQLLGYSNEEIQQLTIQSLVHPEDVDRVMQIHKDRVSGKEVTPRYEFRGIRKDGATIILEVDAVKYFEGAIIAGTQAYIWDITERKLAEPALHDSEEKFRNLFNNAEVGMFRTRLDGSEILDMNDRFLEIFGHTRAEMQGSASAIYWADAREREEMVRQLQAEGRVREFECGMLTKQGEVRRCLTSLVLYRAQGILEGSIIDITERVQAEESLRESEERFRKVFEEAPIGMVLTGRNMQFFSANPAFCQMLGYTAKEVNSRTFLDVTHPDHREMDRKNVEKVWQGKLPHYRTEKRYIAKNGDIRWGSLSTSLIPGRDEKPLYALTMIEDITERKRAQERLLYNGTLLTNLNDAIIASDEGYRITAWNRTAESMYGWKAEEVLGQLGIDITQTEFPGVDKDDMLRTIAERGHWRGEVTQVRKDGSRFPAEISSIVLYDEKKRITGYLSINRDITERKQMEETLHLHSEMLANMAEGVYLVRLDDGIIVDTNPSLERMFGYEPGEMIGNHVSIVNAPTDKKPEETAREIMGIIEKTGAWQGEVSNIKKDGTSFWCSANVSLFDHPLHKTVMLAVHTDITERKLAEEDRDRLFKAVETTKEAVSIQSSDLLTVYANEAMNELFGYEKGELIGRHVSILNAEAMSDASVRQIVDTLEKDGYWEGEVHNKRKDGTELITYATTTVIKDQEGKITQFISTQHDITERVQAEQERERLLKQISLGRERLQTLSQRLLAVQEAERRAIALELHDRIGQDLTALKLLLQSAKRLRDIHPLRQRLDQGIDSLTHISGRVRDLSLDLRPSILDDIGLTAALRWYIDRQMQETEIRVEYHLKTLEHRPEVSIETACFRVAQEALTNILRHAQATVVQVTLAVVEGSLRLVIQDDGVGFDPAEAYALAAGGESLGILGMRERVELTGGELKIDSAPGRGTRLEVRFPLAPLPPLDRREKERDAQ
jgi:PAS domain S-box-containing protein